MSHLILLAVPLFVLLGSLMEISGLARAMIAFLVSLIGHLRGGLQYALLGAMYLVSGISGAKAADMAAVAPALFPEMIKRGNKEGNLTSLLSASAVMSETIPPSIVLITVGSVTGVSIAALFTGGLLPAVVGMIALCVVVFLQSKGEDVSKAQRFTLGQKGKLLLDRRPRPRPADRHPHRRRRGGRDRDRSRHHRRHLHGYRRRLHLPPVRLEARLSDPRRDRFAVRGDPPRRRRGHGHGLGPDPVRFSRQLVELMTLVPGGKVGFLLVSAVAFIVLGSVLEGVPAIVLFGPLLFPIARQMGVNEVHYAMVAVFAMGFGLFTPPFGVGFYLACAIGRVSPDVAIRYAWPHLAALFVALMLIALIPWISIGFL